MTVTYEADLCQGAVHTFLAEAKYKPHPFFFGKCGNYKTGAKNKGAKCVFQKKILFEEMVKDSDPNFTISKTKQKKSI